MGIETPQNEENGGLNACIYDMCHYPSPPKKILLSFKPEDTWLTVRKKITETTGYKSDAFDFTFSGNKIHDETKTLGAEGVKPKFILNLMRNSNAKDSDFGAREVQVSSNLRPIAAAAASTAVVPYVGPSAAGVSSSSSRESSYSGMSSMNYYDWNKKSKTGYVGLSNQGATCYMNSLIQTLFMTPEFRIALYKWNFDETYKKWRESEIEKEKKEAMEVEKKEQPETDDKSTKNDKGNNSGKPLTPEEIEIHAKLSREKDSIPRQLQLLFARLQLRDQKAVKTKDLTNSFGWKESDAFTQHDVQELCRVLFDALEKVLKGTVHENLINDLYQGEMRDYVKCKECGHESARTDKYLDIPLVIRGFGSKVPVKSVEEALEKFVQPELLDKENQYSCDECKKKVDALKGLKFSSFPYLLTLQLKRFDFDYDTFRRIKLNDKVTFPLLLDLNRFVQDSGKDEPAETEDKEEPQEPTGAGENGVDIKTQKKRKLGGESGNGQEEGIPEDKMEDEESAGRGNQKDEESDEEEKLKWDQKVNRLLKNGPYVYELFSVLIHRGSALGGHYYAYTKSFTGGKWFEFNDSQVSEITENDIRKTYGEDADERPRSGMFSMFYSSANAYMLMYRRVDRKKNLPDVTVDEIPEELKKKVMEENEKYKKKIEEKEREREMIKMKVYYEHQPEQLLKLHNSTTLADATRQAAELIGVVSKYPRDCYRLRSYQSYNDLPAEPLDDPEQLNKTLDQLNWIASKNVLLETKEPGTSFPEYNASDMLIRVIKYDRNQNKFLEPVPVSINRDATLAGLKKELEIKFRIPALQQRLLRESYSYHGPPAKILEGDDEELRSDHRVFEGTKLYLEHNDTPEGESPSFAEIERTRNLVELKFNLPGSEDFDQSVQVSKKITFKELKELLQPIVKLPLEEFKVSRGNIHWKFELKNEGDTLEECKLIDGSKLMIEKGKPMKEGETKINFNLFDPENKRTKDYLMELFETPVLEQILIGDLKVQLSQKLKEEKQIEIDPKNMRIREMFTKSPSTVYYDTKTLKESANCLYNGKSLAIQEISGPECKDDEDDIIAFIQQFSPSKYEVGKKVEIKLREEMPLDDFRELISTKFGIENVGIAKAYGSWPGPDVLEIAELDWDPSVPNYPGTSAKSGTVGSAPLYVRDGDILYFRDNQEELKKLTAEEKKALEKEANKSKRTTYTYAKEEALTINAKV